MVFPAAIGGPAAGIARTVQVRAQSFPLPRPDAGDKVLEPRFVELNNEISDDVASRIDLVQLHDRYVDCVRFASPGGRQGTIDLRVMSSNAKPNTLDRQTVHAS